jgi:hypothetical protein
VRKGEFFSDSDNDEAHTAVNTVKSGPVNIKPQLVAESDSIKSMEALIKILVDNMQLLQTKVLGMEKAKQRTDENVGQERQRPRERRTCYNCNPPDHFIKDCRRPPRLSAHRQPKPEGTVKKQQGADHPSNGKESG